jgi:hypothetical protein
MERASQFCRAVQERDCFASADPPLDIRQRVSKVGCSESLYCPSACAVLPQRIAGS